MSIKTDDEIIDLTIREANDKLMHLENLLEYWLNEKEIAFSNTQPHATDISTESVKGGQREDKVLKYLIICEVKEIDEKIELIQNQITNITKYVDSELKRLDEYDPITKKIVELRDKYNKTWNQIHMATNMCPSYCRKLYKLYVGKRFID